MLQQRLEVATTLDQKNEYQMDGWVVMLQAAREISDLAKEF